LNLYLLLFRYFIPQQLELVLVISVKYKSEVIKAQL